MRTTVTRTYVWPMGHRLKDHDGRCRFPHGHTYEAEVTVANSVGLVRSGTKRGMVIDFADLDAAMRAVLDEWDHAFMVEDADPFAAALIDFGDRNDCRLVVVPWPPTAERIAHRLADLVQAALPKGCRVESVRVHEGPKSVAEARF